MGNIKSNGSMAGYEEVLLSVIAAFIPVAALFGMVA